MEEILERLLRRRGSAFGAGRPDQALGVEQLASILLDRKAIPRTLFLKIHEISTLLNQAVHGREPNSDPAKEVLGAGREILGEIEKIGGLND